MRSGIQLEVGPYLHAMREEWIIVLSYSCDVTGLLEDACCHTTVCDNTHQLWKYVAISIPEIDIFKFADFIHMLLCRARPHVVGRAMNRHYLCVT